MKKTYKLVGLVVIVLVVILAFSWGQDTKKQGETIKIGALLPMTGSAAIYGECQYNGALLAAEEINKAGGIDGRKVEIILQDTKADTKEGIAAFSSIKDQVRVAVTSISGVVLSLGPIADKDHIVIMNIGAKNPKISQAGDYVFSTVQNSDADEKVFAQFVKNNLKIDKVALVAVNNDYGLGTTKAFSDAFVALGGKIIANEKYEASATDFRTILTKVKALTPQGTFIVGYKEQGLLLKQASDLGLETQWLAPEPFASPDIIALAGKAADGVIYHIPKLDPQTNEEPTKSYLAHYKERFGKEADFCSANSYDGARLFIQAISEVGNDAEKIKNWLYTVKDWESVTGKTTIDANGDVTKELTIMTVKDGKFVKAN